VTKDGVALINVGEELPEVRGLDHVLAAIGFFTADPALRHVCDA
jgi:hypothetical protein